MFKNIIITKRDMEVFSLLNKIKIIKSSILNSLINNNTEVKTFVKRLKFLKQKGYIEDIRDEKVGEQVFALNYKKNNLEKIEQIINEKIYKGKIDITNSLKNHEIGIGKSLLFIKKAIEKKTKEKVNIRESFISQYQLYEFKNSNNGLKNKKLFNQLMIPDGILNYGKYSFLIEFENHNSYLQFKHKMFGYKKMMLYIESINKNSNIFKNELVLYIFVAGYKIIRYQNIINDVGIKNLKIIIKDLKKLK